MNVHAWQRKQFRIAVNQPPDRHMSVDGIVLASVPALGLHFFDHYGIDVTHIPSGRRIARLSSLGGAMEFVHRIAFLTDWSQEAPAVPPIVGEMASSVEAGALRPYLLPEAT